MAAPDAMIHFHMATSYHVKSLQLGYYPREEGVKNPEMTRKSLNLPEIYLGVSFLPCGKNEVPVTGI